MSSVVPELEAVGTGEVPVLERRVVVGPLPGEPGEVLPLAWSRPRWLR
ncbi:hypothetical protein [Streptomyces sp. NPDC059479]